MKLKRIGCKLICISDLYIPESKAAKKLFSQDIGYVATTKLYDAIENGQIDLTGTYKNITNIPKRPLKSAFHGMAAVAHDKCDQFYRSTKHEADLEIARYAKQHQVMAILSNDTDFLIFDGSWRLWSTEHIRITRANRLITTEYNRKSIKKVLSLSNRQLPLFATLMGNDITNQKIINIKIESFFKAIDPSKHRIHNIADYVRDLSDDIDNFTIISDDDLRRIITPILGGAYDRWEKLIRSSIDSYNTDLLSVHKNDSMEE